MSDSSPTRKRNRLNVGCSHSATELENKAHNELISDLQRIVNHSDYGDVIFICKDGIRVKAIRLLLMSRCKVLEGMLANGMKETSLSEINLPEISSEALLCVFEFLYSGTIVDPELKRWRFLFDVGAAAQFFLLPTLVGIVLELILKKNLEITEDLPEVAAMLTASLEFSHSYQGSECDAINKKLVKLLSSNWTHSVYVANLSEDGLHYLLSQTKAENNYQQVDDKATSDNKELCCKERKKVSLTEYYKFRQVILWWAYQNVPGWSRKVEEKVELAVPLIRDASSLYFDMDIDDETAGFNSSVHLKFFLNDSRDAAKRLLSLIDMRYIHLFLIEKVVRPLNCFSSSHFMKIFRYHALDKIISSVKFNNATCDWKHGRSLKLGGDGASIENCVGGTGSAIALMPMSGKTGIQLWRFVINANSNTNIKVGFICSTEDQVSGWGESNLDKKSLSDLPGVKLLSMHPLSRSHVINRQRKSRKQVKRISQLISGKPKVLFQLDFEKRNCSLILDGKDYGICWNDLPEEECYPAVSVDQRKGPCSRTPSSRPPSGVIRIQTAHMKDSESMIEWSSESESESDRQSDYGYRTDWSSDY